MAHLSNETRALPVGIFLRVPTGPSPFYATSASVYDRSSQYERPAGRAASRSCVFRQLARELASLYLRAPEVTRRNTRIHFIWPLKERIVREVGYGLSLEGAAAADLVKSIQMNHPR